MKKMEQPALRYLPTTLAARKISGEFIVHIEHMRHFERCKRLLASDVRIDKFIYEIPSR